MNRRKGELTPGAIDRGWPFQIILLAELSLGKLGAEQAFATKAGAETFMEQYGGEWFDPRERGRGEN
ncbi:hypothetical protein [Rhizobium binxianense]|uniref:hypothetical protein n=1 Tax=Rhizobium binxianense TaxID=3024242 RepID=UPI002361D4FC|nr:hypothetical protein [Rhizobium sp. MJ37]MDC9835548.1 hypothetical protein [Rhizobium sp. MJ37]